ncbi:UNVERIFIED_CONTAM: hypothetical protein Scaly_0790800 [Sesamum calycinum]|uniref:Uncharacterized protein n=1 Tax=Sesamum calycinum TaxID=2727403 RepID=A0AAW2R990_9LAMI
MKHLHTTLVLILLLSISSCVQCSRLLHDEEEALKEKGIFIHSLEKGPVPPSGPSGCTNIPGSGGSGCPIKEMHFAGGHAPPRPGGSTAYPHSSAAAFGVATKQK